jgi:hypothetical protein
VNSVGCARALPLVLPPGFVEEVVLRVIGRSRLEPAFRRARDRLYRLPPGECRERAFQELHAAWFAGLGAARPIETALAEFTLLQEHCIECVVTQARRRDDDGADLLVKRGDDGSLERRVALALRPAAFDDPSSLQAWLRLELMCVADMVDPAFGYEPALPGADGGPMAARAVQERYRALWTATAVGRLERRGGVPLEASTAARRALVNAFPMLGEAAHKLFAQMSAAELPTHAALAAWAVAPRSQSLAAVAASGAAANARAQRLTPGSRCPLCRFPTFAPAPDILAAAVVQQIRADFPVWRPGDGLCLQCADLYRARPGRRRQCDGSNVRAACQAGPLLTGGRVRYCGPGRCGRSAEARRDRRRVGLTPPPRYAAPNSEQPGSRGAPARNPRAARRLSCVVA